MIDLSFNYFNILPKKGFIGSRLSYIFIFFISFFPLLKLIHKDKPNFLIAHLITSLPIFLFNFFKFKSNLILRISGMPKLHLLRKFFWKFSSKKIQMITCPTIELKKKIVNLDIFEKQKIFFLPDAVINILDFKIQMNELNILQIFKEKKVFLSAGRLTRQKNFEYLINEFTKFGQNKNKYALVILGDGEEYPKLIKLIKKNKMQNKIFLPGRVKNIYRYMKDAESFILSSKWEEMGFVIIEAAFSNLLFQVIVGPDLKNF